MYVNVFLLHTCIQKRRLKRNLQSNQLDKLSEFYKYLDTNGDGTLVISLYIWVYTFGLKNNEINFRLWMN